MSCAGQISISLVFEAHDPLKVYRMEGFVVCWANCIYDPVILISNGGRRRSRHVVATGALSALMADSHPVGGSQTWLNGTRNGE